MPEPRVLVFTTDDKAKPLQWLLFALQSAQKAFGDELNGLEIFVMTDAPDAVGAFLKSHAPAIQVKVVDVRKTIEASGLTAVSALSFHGRNISPLQMFRLALPIEPSLDDYSKVVFCDTDVEFRSSKWLRIFGEDVTGVDVAAVMDRALRPRLRIEACRELWTCGAASEAPEKNLERLRSNQFAAAGLMVMNLERLRTAHGDYGEFLRKMVDLCVRHNLPQLDQSLINLFYDFRLIPPQYNAWPSCVPRGAEEWMHHFAGPQKVRISLYPPDGHYRRPDRPVDVVYTVGHIPSKGDVALKYSLRSIAKNCTNIGRVIVVSPEKGGRKWLSDEVEQVYCADLPLARYKHQNILNAILFAIDKCDLHGEFLVSSDDHFYLEPTDFANYPFRFRGWRIPNRPNKKDILPQTVFWKQSLIDTGKLLFDLGLPTLNFQMHSNSHWNADIVRDNIDLFRAAQTLTLGVEPHVLMQNLWLAIQPDLPITKDCDTKTRAVADIGENQHCVSFYHDFKESDSCMVFLMEHFGEPCKYERQQTAAL